MKGEALACRGLRHGACVALWFATAGIAAGQSTQRASLAADGSEIPGDSEIGRYGALSDDGRFVVFVSAQDGITAGDGNGKRDVFLRDMVAGTTQLVSHTRFGVSGDDESYEPAMTPDGAFVVFTSRATDFAPNDNPHPDVFLWERATDKVARISNGMSGGTGNGYSECPSISGDGRYVAFRSYAKNLVPVDINKRVDAFVYDRSTDSMRLVSLDDHGKQLSSYTYLDYTVISKDGSTIAFVTDARLVSFDTGGMNVYAIDLASGAPELVDITITGGRGSITPLEPVYLSADGRWVAFKSAAPDLVNSDRNGTLSDIFLRDRLLQTTEVASLDNEGLQPFVAPSYAGPISDDGRYVSFLAVTSDYLPDEFGVFGVLLRDRAIGMTLVASRFDTGEQGTGALYNYADSLSSDARLVAFSSPDALVDEDGNGKRDVYVRERAVDTAEWSSYGAGLAGRHGVPGLALDAPPQLTRDVTLSVGNSSGSWAIGIVVFGLDSADVPLFGGSLLVLPLVSTTIVLPPAGFDLSFRVPPDELIVGVPIYVQAMQLDPWAIDGVSLTRGIEAAPGY